MPVRCVLEPLIHLYCVIKSTKNGEVDCNYGFDLVLYALVSPPQIFRYVFREVHNTVPLSTFYVRFDFKHQDAGDVLDQLESLFCTRACATNRSVRLEEPLDSFLD